MGKSLIDRYIWLIDTVNQSDEDGITFKEINKKWHRCQLSDKKDYPLRTFHNHRKEIKDIFNIEIACNNDTNRYYIEKPRYKGLKDITNLLYFSLSLNNIITSHPRLHKRIIVENNITYNYPNLSKIIKAIETNKKINFSIVEDTDTSKEFDFQIKNEFVDCEPYFLKNVNNKWFVTCLYNDNLQTFDIADFVKIKVTSDSFKIPKDFDIEDYIVTHSSEFICDTDEQYNVTKSDKKGKQSTKCVDEFTEVSEFRFPAITPEKDSDESTITVQLKMYEPYRSYYKQKPLHKTQEEVINTRHHTIFSYNIVMDDHFYMVIKAMGNKVEIMKPLSLRTFILNESEKVNHLYTKNKDEDKKSSSGQMIQLF